MATSMPRTHEQRPRTFPTNALSYPEPMQPIQGDQAQVILNAVCMPALKNEQKITKSVIAAIPLDKGDYKPDQISKSALELAWHVVSTEMRFMDAVVKGEFDLTPTPLPESIRNSADLVAWYDENFPAHVQKLTTLSDEQLLKVIPFRGILQLPAVSYLLILMHHSVHHRGQLSMYLRPMGAKVPSIYGESYDSAEARKASQTA